MMPQKLFDSYYNKKCVTTHVFIEFYHQFSPFEYTRGGLTGRPSSTN